MGNTIAAPPVNMNLLTQSPGLRHLAETIFMNLSPEDLLFKCQEVNDQWRSIVRNPLIWLKKCEGLTKEKSVSKSTRKLIEGYYNLYLADELTQIPGPSLALGQLGRSPQNFLRSCLIKIPFLSY